MENPVKKAVKMLSIAKNENAFFYPNSSWKSNDSNSAFIGFQS